MEAITKSMSENMALLPLRSLQIECKCTFSNTAVTSLALFFKNSTSLNCVGMFKNIDWKASHISKSDKQTDIMRFSVITTGLHYNRISHLNLSNNNISVAVATALAQALHHNSTLNELNLSSNNISDVGATDLAQALHHNSTLEKLYLSSNNISDVGATDLAQALHHNSTLNELHLSNNNISDVGATDLAQALQHNSTLKMLHLDGNNGIGEEGTPKLVQALTVNTSVNRLWLPKRCEEYALQYIKYNAVKTRISFWKQASVACQTRV